MINKLAAVVRVDASQRERQSDTQPLECLDDHAALAHEQRHALDPRRVREIGRCGLRGLAVVELEHAAKACDELVAETLVRPFLRRSR